MSFRPAAGQADMLATILVSLRKHPRFGIALFVYGALAHLGAFRYLIYRNASEPGDTAFIDHPLTNLAIAVLGGFFVAAFQLLLREQVSWHPEMSQFNARLTAGLYGMLATFLAIGSFCVLCALALTFYAPVGAVEHFWVFVGALISVFTYGMIFVILSVPFGLLHGLGAGLLILKLEGRSSSDQP